jgi:hypothetical protein
MRFMVFFPRRSAGSGHAWHKTRQGFLQADAGSNCFHRTLRFTFVSIMRGAAASVNRAALAARAPAR